MTYRILADLLVFAHFSFLIFVVGGGFLVARWPRVAWLHIPCALWGAWVELAGWICPLTPLEVTWRRQAGQAGYEGGFIEHYIIPILYPSGLTREIQVGLGIAVIVLNVALYTWAWRRSRSSDPPSNPDIG